MWRIWTGAYTSSMRAETVDNDRHDRVRPPVPLGFGYARQRTQKKNDVSGINPFAHLTGGFSSIKQHPERFMESVVLVRIEVVPR